MQKIFISMFVVIILDTSNKHIYVEKNNIYFLKVVIGAFYTLDINKTYRFRIPYMLKLLCTVLVLFGSRGKQDA